MAAQVSYEQRLQVRTALREAGVNQETVDEIEAGDLDVLYANGWKSKGLILNAQEKHLVESRLSLGAVGVIMGLAKQGEPSFLTCFCSWEIFLAWRKSNSPRNRGPLLDTITRAPCIPILAIHLYV